MPKTQINPKIEDTKGRATYVAKPNKALAHKRIRPLLCRGSAGGLRTCTGRNSTVVVEAAQQKVVRARGLVEQRLNLSSSSPSSFSLNSTSTSISTSSRSLEHLQGLVVAVVPQRVLCLDVVRSHEVCAERIGSHVTQTGPRRLDRIAVQITLALATAFELVEPANEGRHRHRHLSFEFFHLFFFSKFFSTSVLFFSSHLTRPCRPGVKAQAWPTSLALRLAHQSAGSWPRCRGR